MTKHAEHMAGHAEAGSAAQDAPYSFIVGVSVSSAIGSLPYHLTPLIILALVTHGDISASRAGLIPLAMMSGQLIASLLLPKFSGARANAMTLAVAIGTLVVGLLIARSGEFNVLLGGWLIVGLSSGALIYLGTLEAAKFQHRSFAFVLRLGIVQLIVAASSAALQILETLADYDDLVVFLIAVCPCVVIVGLLIARLNSATDEAGPRNDSPQANIVWKAADITGLFVLFVFFVGQSGILAHIIQKGASGGLGLSFASWSFVTMKLVAALWLLYLAAFRSHLPKDQKLGMLTGALLVSLVLITQTRHAATFLVGLVVFAICFNAISAKYQSFLTSRKPELVGRWLVASILLGAAIGPLINGLAIDYGFEELFIGFALVAALAPVVNCWFGGVEAEP